MNRVVYPVLQAEEFKEAIQNGGKIELEVVPSDCENGYAWRVYVIGADGTKSKLSRQRKIRNYDVRTANGILALVRETGAKGVFIPSPYDCDFVKK